jgi:hypothetical protein
MTCSLLYALFITALACVIAGHRAGVLAWRHRLPQYPRWQWLYDPTYAFRSSYYQDPKPGLRIVAATLLTVAGLLVVVLVGVVISASRSGARGICGLAF